jgi:hypothetical protein
MSPAAEPRSDEHHSDAFRSGERPGDPLSLHGDRLAPDLDQSPPPEDGEAIDLVPLVAAAADLCRPPLRHGVVLQGDASDTDCCLHLEARDGEGARLPQHDLELELFRSGSGTIASLHLTLAWLADDERPILWQGQHPVWMDGQGQRCQRPEGGEALEALARRLRALLAASS